eukprot:m.75331 g.75331  ORF g.75331 m.75331 type:complete len:353 (+) comp8477_c0_seq2:134-1192(+)
MDKPSTPPPWSVYRSITNIVNKPHNSSWPSPFQNLHHGRPLQPVGHRHHQYRSLAASVGDDTKSTPSVQHPTHIAYMRKFLVSSAAAACAESATFPLDLIKTRVMVSNTETPLSAFQSIIKNEGVKRLWFGATPAVMRHIIYSGARMSLYELFRDMSDGHNSPTRLIVCGFFSGIIGQFIASPTDLLKVRLSAQKPGSKRAYKSTLHAFTTIVKQEGVLGLWKGCIPNVQRAAVVNLADVATYDITKRIYVKNFGDNYFSYTLASLTSSFVTALLCTPVDLIKTRIMNQEVVNGKGVLYDGVIDCFKKTKQAEGVRAMWRGFLPNWFRMAPWSFVFWISYEKLRKIVGVGSF